MSERELRTQKLLRLTFLTDAAWQQVLGILLDGYWVGPLDFNFLGNKAAYHQTPKKLNFLQRVNSNQDLLGLFDSWVLNSTWYTSIVGDGLCFCSRLPMGET